MLLLTSHENKQMIPTMQFMASVHKFKRAGHSFFWTLACLRYYVSASGIECVVNCLRHRSPPLISEGTIVRSECSGLKNCMEPHHHKLTHSVSTVAPALTSLPDMVSTAGAAREGCHIMAQ